MRRRCGRLQEPQHSVNHPYSQFQGEYSLEQITDEPLLREALRVGPDEPHREG